MPAWKHSNKQNVLSITIITRHTKTNWPVATCQPEKQQQPSECCKCYNHYKLSSNSMPARKTHHPAGCVLLQSMSSSVKKWFVMMCNDRIMCSNTIYHFVLHVRQQVFTFFFIAREASIAFVFALKGLAQAKIIKKSLILFWPLNMTIWCKHVHRLELQKFFNFSAAHSPVRLDIETKFPYF